MAGEIPPPFLRLFTAIAIPPDVRNKIERAQGQLRRNTPPGLIRWTKPEQFHVTLKFLGDVPSDQLPVVNEAVSTVCAGFPPLRLSARGIGFFPGSHKPRVLWAGAADETGKLGELHRRLDEALRPFADADRPGKFTGHITLGRFKPGRPATLRELLERAAVFRDRDFGRWLAEAVEVVRCDLTPAGALHTPLAACRLAG